MAELSQETRELLDRAQRAIDRAGDLRTQTRKGMSDAERRLFELERSIYRKRALELGPNNRG
jgi:hypothetical protein